MPLTPGTRLGPYEIVGTLGSGGMGEVYRARDTRLDRTVAIKILPEQFTADPAAKQRFDREAKTISSLNHPNICTLYDVGHQDGMDFLVMECVEGETLAQRLEKGPLTLEQTVKYGVQIAEALDQAHRSGIVHRDLKPGNIMLTSTGAKLLDFGLAKGVSAVPTATGSAMTVTALPATPVTQQGTILGTFQYMSPEQVEGKELDGRSDIFSLGAVLYEMLTGKRAFEGKTQLSVASAILEREPVPLRTAKPLTPPALEHAIARCLAKDPEERWQTARDLAIELKWTGASQPAPVHERAAEKKGSPLPWLLCGALAIALLAGGLVWRSSHPSVRTMYFSAPFPFSADSVAISPNGHTVAVAAYRDTARKSVIWMYEIGVQDATILPGSEGASFPFWSPDGQTLAFFADGKLKKKEIAGGPLQTICDAPTGRGGTWNKDGVIVFTPTGQLMDGLYRTTSSGDPPKKITTPDLGLGETTHRWAQFLPDGKHFLYLAANVTGESSPDGIYVGALDSSERKLIVRTSANAVYADGYLFYRRENSLLAQGFDPEKLTLSGEATVVVTNIQYETRIAHLVFDASANGLLLAQKSTEVSLSRLVWYDRKGAEVGAVGGPNLYANAAIAPNEKEIAVDKTDNTSQNTDVWTYQLNNDLGKRLTFDPAMDAYPVWSPDSAKIAFSSTRQHVFDLYVKDADGAQEEKLILHNEGDKFPNSWSPDGKTLLFVQNNDLWSLTFPDLKAEQFLKAASALKNAQFSPDGKMVAYTSNETGRWEVYVTLYPGARGKWQVSTAGGEQPRWRKDGKELYYIGPDGSLMAVPVRPGQGFDFGTPAALFQTSARAGVATSEQIAYDVNADGSRFLINTQVKKSTNDPLTVVLHWNAELKK